MDSLKLRQYLRAISGNNDETLKNNNLNPNELRQNFYKNFNKTFESIPYNHIHFELCEKTNTCKDYMIIDLGSSCGEFDEDLGEGYESHDYFFIGQTHDNNFIMCDIECQTPCTRINQYPDYNEWKIYNERPANFVEITMKYHLLIVDICEKWSFKTITNWIRDNN